MLFVLANKNKIINKAAPPPPPAVAPPPPEEPVVLLDKIYDCDTNISHINHLVVHKHKDV